MPEDEELKDEELEGEEPEDEELNPELIVPLPEPIVLPSLIPAEEQKPERPADELADLFEVPQEEDNDMYTDDLFELDDEEDLSDLTRVTREDVMGKPRKARPPKYLQIRRPYYPPTSIGRV